MTHTKSGEHFVIKTSKASDCLESEVTPESIYRQRRKFIKSSSLLAVAGLTFQGKLMAQAESARGSSSAPLAGTDLQDEVTAFKDVTRYNNFYEFGTDKTDPAKYARDFDTSGWTVEVTGECARPGKLDLEDLIAGVDVEDRIYRLRCVEAWSMVIPWRGVELGKVLSKFEPTSKAKYVAFRTLLDPERMPGQKRPVLEWPYREGLRMDEAMHPLTLLATGMYGKDMPNQNGAPVRLVVPWKYGFKSIKSIVSIEFSETQPETSWNLSQPSEYGFYSNVNPEVSHPRWSQARERRIGEFFKRKTLMFNGYADEVASLYSGMDLRKHI
jgi:sulfoxide reductase catalytic subunit YedY